LSFFLYKIIPPIAIIKTGIPIPNDRPIINTKWVSAKCKTIMNGKSNKI
jgi:hypothetical protein